MTIKRSAGGQTDRGGRGRSRSKEFYKLIYSKISSDDSVALDPKKVNAKKSTGFVETSACRQNKLRVRGRLFLSSNAA